VLIGYIFLPLIISLDILTPILKRSSHWQTFYSNHCIAHYIYVYVHMYSRDSIVDIVTRYGDRIPMGARCSVPVQTGRGPTSPPPTPPSSVEDTAGVGLCLYTPSGPSCPFLGWNFASLYWSGLVCTVCRNCLHKSCAIFGK